MSRAIFERAPDKLKAYPTGVHRLLPPRLRHYVRIECDTV